MKKKLVEIVNGDSYYFHISEFDSDETIVREYDLDFQVEDKVYSSGDHKLFFRDMNGNDQYFATRCIGAIIMGKTVKKALAKECTNALKDFYAFSVVYDYLPFDFDKDILFNLMVFLRGDSTKTAEINMRPRNPSELGILMKMFNKGGFPGVGSRYGSWRHENDLFLDYRYHFNGRTNQEALDKIAFYESDKFQPDDYLGLKAFTSAVTSDRTLDAWGYDPTILSFWKKYPYLKTHVLYPEELHPDQNKEPFEVYPYISNVEYEKLCEKMDMKGDCVSRFMIHLLFRYGLPFSCIAGLTYEDLILCKKDSGKNVMTFCNYKSDKGIQKKKKAELTRGAYDSPSFVTVDVEDMFLTLETTEEDEKLIGWFLKQMKEKGKLVVKADSNYGRENWYLFVDEKNKLYSASSWTKNLQKYFNMIGIPEIAAYPDYAPTARLRNGYAMNVLFFSDEYLDENKHFGFNPEFVASMLTPVLNECMIRNNDDRFPYRYKREEFSEYWLMKEYRNRRKNLVVREDCI